MPSLQLEQVELAGDDQTWTVKFIQMIDCGSKQGVKTSFGVFQSRSEGGLTHSWLSKTVSGNGSARPFLERVCFSKVDSKSVNTFSILHTYQQNPHPIQTRGSMPPDCDIEV